MRLGYLCVRSDFDGAIAETGETGEPMPGTTSEFVADPDEDLRSAPAISISLDKMPSFLRKVLEVSNCTHELWNPG